MTPDDSKLIKRRQALLTEFCNIQKVFSNGGTFPRRMTAKTAHYRLIQIDNDLRDIDCKKESRTY